MNRLLFTRLKFHALETDKSLVQGSEIAVAIEVGIHLNDVSPLAVARISDGYRHLSVSFIGWFGCRSLSKFALLSLLPIGRRSHAGFFFEALAEILRVGEAAGIGNLRERVFALDDELLGTLHTDLPQEVGR